MNELDNEKQLEEIEQEEVPGNDSYPVPKPKTEKERVQDMIDLLKVDSVKCMAETKREKNTTLKITYEALSREFAHQARLLELTLKRMK